ncbi:MAG: MgtC/SapB family protein [Saprospiraceae bacterium]|nr:MgtC/SapB family protein [Saprospiraceae bacterium]
MDWLDSLNTVLTPFFIGLLVAAGVGLIIGLEREFNTHDKPGHLGGIRTFALVAVLGYVTAWIASQNYMSVLICVLAGFFLLVAVAYHKQAMEGNMGLTTEVALLMTLVLGVTIAAGYMREALAVVVLTTLILSLKEQLHGIIRRITQEELFAFIKFIVLVLLILPLLPDEPFGPEGLLNLRDLGWIAVLVLSISFAGYLMLKFGSPQKGIMLTAVLGGLFSSTLIAWVFSARSRERKDVAPAFGAGIVLASTIMFVRVFTLTTVFYYPVAWMLFPALLLMLLVSLLPSWNLLRNRSMESETPQLEPGNPLDIKNAVFFVLLYIGVTLLMFGSRQWLGTTLTYLSGALAGIADMDAITISTSKWAAATPDSNRQAAIIILLAVMSNSVFKLLVSVFNGAAELRRPVLLGFGLVLLVGVIFLMYWLIG